MQVKSYEDVVREILSGHEQPFHLIANNQKHISEKEFSCLVHFLVNKGYNILSFQDDDLKQCSNTIKDEISRLQKNRKPAGPGIHLDDLLASAGKTNSNKMLNYMFTSSTSDFAKPQDLKQAIDHLTYYDLRQILNQALDTNSNHSIDKKFVIIIAIFQNTNLMITDADKAKAIQQSTNSQYNWENVFEDRQKKQATWDLRKMTGAPEEVVDTTASEEVVEDKNTSTPNDNGKKPAQKQSNYNFGPVLAPIALNLLLHAVHNIIPVYYSSIAAIGVAYICKRKSETQHTKLYNNTMLASAANLCLLAYLNSESELVQAGSLIGIVVASYQYYQINKDQSINAPEL
ncbi:MAG: hypothetical protein LW826_03305 [Candidatus Jidaibacter sp.]|jgi:hypothetical protein|nr:hypothetical protein [Candidatus Jidaibacter sp.]